MLYSIWNVQCYQVEIFKGLAITDPFVYLSPLLVVCFAYELVFPLKIEAIPLKIVIEIFDR